MPRRTKEEAEETKRILIQIARAEITEHGYDHLSLETLAEKAGVTRGAVYHHFTNKLGLFTQLVHRISEEMGNRIADWAASGPSKGEDAIEALRLGTEGFLTESQAPDYQQIILTEAPAVLGVRAWQEIDDRYTTGTLVEAFEDLGFSSDAQVLAQGFSGAMNQLSRWISSKEDIDKALKTLERMFEPFLFKK
jgi:AcrR family transcriptional regulator